MRGGENRSQAKTKQREVRTPLLEGYEDRSGGHEWKKGNGPTGKNGGKRPQKVKRQPYRGTTRTNVALGGTYRVKVGERLGGREKASKGFAMGESKEERGKSHHVGVPC